MHMHTLSPERERAQACGTKADVWAAGVVLAETVSGLREERA
eukprot:CAMPEP_0181327826 /NCGR_PEP_ID=MMETSP1101-20121128/22334_1 /TAXON_ID=46948 /ORGANISM="Rhodomonas abbreviata, Strain Caron Lab Isolate" /LENGTH=41 /DNA_ID= /DNA_START= /DNA_END= /DNA_ORIENTATION=